jgi:hypothetical protein
MDVRELQAKLCYSVIVAGKSAQFADQATAKLWLDLRPDELPFQLFKRLGSQPAVHERLVAAGTGNYNKIAKCFWQLAFAADLDFATCGPAQLEEFHGIGPKTSRFFIMWVRPGERYAALDVHILRWMGRQGYKVPKHTPASPKVYAALEEAFIAEADKRGKTPRELDWEVWSSSTRDRGVVQSL